MPFVPGTVDTSGGDVPASQAPSSPGGDTAGGALPETYQLMAAALMHKMGRFANPPPHPGVATPAVSKAQAISRKAAKSA
jgi:hypothetical protein